MKDEVIGVFEALENIGFNIDNTALREWSATKQNSKVIITIQEVE